MNKIILEEMHKLRELRKVDERTIDRLINLIAEHIAKRAEYYSALKKLTEIVDSSLLLDEDLANDWDVLNKAVQEARKLLGEINE